MKLNYTFSIVLAFITMSFLLVPLNPDVLTGTKTGVLDEAKEEEVKFRIYNDPHTDHITIFYKAAESGNGLVSVFYSDGKLDGRKLVSIHAGTNTWEYRFANISTGMYIVRFARCGMEETGKVYKTIQ